MLKVSSTSIHSLNLFLELGTTVFCWQFSHAFSSATFNSETVFGFKRRFQKTSCITPQKWYLQAVQI